MTFVLMSNILSPHQAPLGNALVEALGYESVVYVASEPVHEERKSLGWSVERRFRFLQRGADANTDSEIRRSLETAEILLTGCVDIPLFRRRAKRGLTTLYMAERWFRPPRPFWRYLASRFFMTCWGLSRLLQSGRVTYLAIGVHAASDMARWVALSRGGLAGLARAPRVEMVDRAPLSRFALAGDGGGFGPARCGLSAMRLWAYFVDPCDAGAQEKPACGGRGGAGPLRMLWAGRMLGLKHVDLLVGAVCQLLDEGERVLLRLVGEGPEEPALRALALRHLASATEAGCEGAARGIVFEKPLPIGEVRARMRSAEVYVLASDGAEGWGAVVNEAMSEGCCVIATRESGAGVTLIVDGVNGLLYSAWCQAELYAKIKGLLRDRASAGALGLAAQQTLREAWSPKAAAAGLLREFVR